MLQPPTLTTTTADDVPPPPLPTGDDPAVTSWRDAQGRLGALSHAVDGRLWLHVLDVASFLLDVASDRVVAIPRAGVAGAAVEDEFQRTVRPLMLQLRGFEILHASAVRVGNGVVAFCAPSEGGKSTLAYAFGRAGHPLWADDAVVLDVAPTAVRTLPLAFDVRLRPASAVHFGSVDSRWTRGRQVLPGEAADAPRDLDAVCVLRRVERLVDDDLVEVRALPPARSVPILLGQAVFFGLDDRERKRRMIEAFLAVAARVPVHEVRYRTGLDHLPAVVTAIADALGPACPP